VLSDSATLTHEEGTASCALAVIAGATGQSNAESAHRKLKANDFMRLTS
jgi:hypothetical protein